MSERINEELAARAAEGDGSALEVLVIRNLPLVRSLARRYSSFCEKDDLVQAGAIGLVRAARGFDPKNGARFSTYAVPFIRGEMLRCLRANGTKIAAEELEHGYEEDASETVRELLWSLAPQDAELISLRYFVGLNQRETGERLGLSQSAVSRREGRIMKRMRGMDLIRH